MVLPSSAHAFNCRPAVSTPLWFNSVHQQSVKPLLSLFKERWATRCGPVERVPILLRSVTLVVSTVPCAIEVVFDDIDTVRGGRVCRKQNRG